ncbi:MAG TPA: tocopherol cyclase family protein [Dermatophilaceae bacterium]
MPPLPVLARARRAVSTLASTMHPDGFHGARERAGFFEGWYVKLVSGDRASRIAVIPGIFVGLEDSAGRHDEAFVQVLDGSTGRSWYERYDAADFHAATGHFDVTIGPNRFNAKGMTLDLPASGLRGRVEFTTAFDPWPVTVRSPGIMGWYAWAPVMECYHGVVSFGHDLSGSLSLVDEPLSFDGGRGYLEKDWGRAFPSGYIWMQSSHFARSGVCLVASIAVIPWHRTQFRGFVVGLRMPGPDGRPQLHRFATYTGAHTTTLTVDDDHVHWSLRSKAGVRLDLSAERRRGGLLHAPVRTQMHRRVEETLDARIHLRLTDRDGRVILDDCGEVAGLEVHGHIDELLAMA